MRKNPLAFGLSAAFVCLVATTGQSLAQTRTFASQDIEVCPSKWSVLDPEFDSKSQLMVFMDAQARVRVTSLNADGTIGAAGCAGSIVDANATWGWPDGGGGFNGPEWGRSQRGLEIFYLKPMADGTPQLAHAWGGGTGGGWQTELLGLGWRRSTILVSTNDSDPQARLMYLYRSPAGQMVPMWRESNQPSTENAYPGMFNKATGSAPRWVDGQRAIAMTGTDGAGVQQAARYDIDTRETTLLTSTPGNKAEVWIWSAPEFGGDMVLSTVVDGTSLAIYRQVGGPSGTWTLINTIQAASMGGLTQIFSPEPRVVRGRSYVAMQVGNQLYDVQSQIWVASIDPAAPLLRQISDPTTLAIRTEPEWFVSNQGAFVYYSQQPPTGGAAALRRAATGLANAAP